MTPSEQIDRFADLSCRNRVMSMQRSRPDPSQRESNRSIRQALMELLEEEQASALEISQILGIPEKEVYLHLEHIERTLLNRGRKLVTHPFSCLDCGFLFTNRKRFSRPGRCPKCKGSHLGRATYEIV